jgi:D-alanyl-D-alanine carboxypeptidase/D-alanyl-D-alanine-endopeptidase (penicillin-binding protein 4)
MKRMDAVRSLSCFPAHVISGNALRVRRGKLSLIAVVAMALGLAAFAPDTKSKAKPKEKAKSPVASSSTGLSDSITRLLSRPELKGATVGVHVLNLTDGKALFSRDADRLLIPASNTKLFTTAAALSTLGPQFEFRTVLGTAGKDLVVVGSGDPTIGGRFTDGDPTEYFRRWAAVLKQQRITRIGGDLLLDDSYFDRQFVHPDWPKNDLGHWYAAPVAALVLNDSCIDVRIAPGSAAQTTAQVSLIPNTKYFDLTNRTRIVKSAKEHAPRAVRGPGNRTILCDGGVYERAQPITSWLPVDDPVQFFGVVLREVLAEEGIAIAGGVKSAPGAGKRTDFQVRAVHRFQLQPVLEVTNKESQNLYAEQIFKTLGALRHDGSWKGGRQAVLDALAKLNIDAGGFEIVDGCGLSRSNRASPRAFTSLLAAMNRGSYGTQFRSTLSEAGSDGTLKKRLHEDAYRDRIWAKTGSISGVRSISGYVQSRSGDLLAFSFIANNVRSSVREIQDDFCKALANWSESDRVVRQERASGK